MDDIPNGHARRLFNSLVEESGADIAEEVVGRIRLPKAPSEKKEQWVNHITSELETKFDKETVKTIRMRCACGPSTAMLEKIRGLYEKSEDLKEFSEKSNAKHKDFTMWVEDKTLFFAYPACYCSMVKHRDIPSPSTWCACTVGYTKKMFSYCMGHEVEVILLESIKQGSNRCVMKIVS